MTEGIKPGAPVVSFASVAFAYPENDLVLSGVSPAVPPGVTGIVGPNGIGKSTFLLLAGARLFPGAGTVTILGDDTTAFRGVADDPALEERRNRIASFIYQNMEFETEAPVGEVLRYVDGTRDDAVLQADPLHRIIEAMELAGETDKRMQELSKGAMQRTIIALSLLYGAPLLLMDEPVFAVEPGQADRVFEYLCEYAARSGVSILYSAHDVEFTRRHSDRTLLFYAGHGNGGDGASGGTASASKAGEPSPRIEVGLVEDMLTRDRLEEAYRAPYDTLKQRETLYRQVLIRTGG